MLGFVVLLRQSYSETQAGLSHWSDKPAFSSLTCLQSTYSSKVVPVKDQFNPHIMKAVISVG